jgi:DNA polymerase III gamma/tau subunit
MTLKLLEIERPNTYFILCTMNPKAFHKAILSRGQVYQFKKLPLEVIGEYLMDIVEAEDPEERLPDSFIEEGVVAIAEHSGGNLRQAISLLERALNSELYDRDSIEREFGVVGEEKTFRILNEFLALDPVFFQHIREVELKAFYYYAWKVLNESAVRSFGLEGEDPDDLRELDSVYLNLKNHLER